MGQVSYLENENIKISRGLVKNAIPVHKSGYNSSLQNGVEEVIWNGASAEPYIPLIANNIILVSNDALDVGIQVTLYGLDSNYNQIQETLTANGTSPVTSSNSFIRVSDVICTNGVAPTGALEIRDGSNVVSTVTAGVNHSLKAQYTVPAGYTGYLYKGDASVGKGGDAEIKMYVRPFGGVWIVGHVAQIYENQYNYDFPFPQPIQEKSDIKVTALSTSTGAKVGCNFDILLVKNLPEQLKSI